jgi:dephospho-CoA kinase
MQSNQAIFMVGSPGSGKDVVIRDICSNFDIVEFTSTQIDEMLSNDAAFKRAKPEKQHSLLESRSILVTANAYDLSFIVTKEILEAVGYTTHLILVEANLATSYNRLHNRNNLKESLDKISGGNSNKLQILQLFSSNVIVDNSQVLDLTESRQFVSSILDELHFKSDITLEDITKIKLKKKLKGVVPGNSVDNRGLTPGTWSSYIGVSESIDVPSYDLSPIATGPMQKLNSVNSDLRSDQQKQNTKKVLNKTKAILFKKVAVPKNIE